MYSEQIEEIAEFSNAVPSSVSLLEEYCLEFIFIELS